MAEAGTWASIQRHGLRSTQALLDLFEISGDRRTELLDTRRPQMVPLTHPTHGAAQIRDNKPLKDSFLETCLTDMTRSEWYAHLNSRVFFWVTERRLADLLAARAYKNRPHDVITVDTRRLIEMHAVDITVASFNTGSTIYPNAPARGSETFQTIAMYDAARTPRSKRLRTPIVELTVDYAVADVGAVAIRAERRENGKTPILLWEG
jgi:uncharacterized protein DUF7002